jgi:hypothetical protein
VHLCPAEPRLESSCAPGFYVLAGVQDSVLTDLRNLVLPEPPPPPFSELGVFAHVVRDPWPMFYNVMCIHGLICSASLAVFLYDDPIDRIESLFTIVTAAVAHKFVAVQNLPVRSLPSLGAYRGCSSAPASL